MKKFKVFAELDDQWHYFGTFPAESGLEAIKFARESTSDLLKWFNSEDLPYVNLDYEEIEEN
jgi:hypothetical protein